MNDREEFFSEIKFFIGFSLIILLLLTFCVFGSFGSLCKQPLVGQKDNIINITSTIVNDITNEFEITVNKAIPFKVELRQDERGGEYQVQSVNINNHIMLYFLAKLICYIATIIFLILLFKLVFNFYEKINHDDLSYKKAIEALRHKPDYTETKNVNLTIKEEGSTKTS